MKRNRTSPNNLSAFSRSLWLTFGMFVLLALAFVAYVRSEKLIDRAYELRLQSYRLADELRHSSNDLSRMARSYVFTGNPLYKQHYQEVFEIRNGKRPRPVDYQNIYWDLVLENDRRPRPYGKAIALFDLMQQAGFSEEEFIKLAEIKAKSEALTEMEFAAMKLSEDTRQPTEHNRFKASQMLRNIAYHQAKADFMRPLSELNELIGQRTRNAVQSATTNAVILRVVFILFVAILMLALWHSYRVLCATLGADVEVLRDHIARLGNGDFAAAIPIGKAKENSIIAWLSETQRRLAQINAERNESAAKNQRMTQLYAALSQCNQAIVRCDNEPELFGQICKDAVCFGGMELAWIGLIDGQNQQVVPVAYYGKGSEYLEGICISINADEATGRGPTGISLREDRPFWCQDFQHDPATLPWHERGAKYGWNASATLPLHRNGKVIGSFTVYSLALAAFDQAASNLLVEMAMDIDFALNNLDREAQRQQADMALADSHKLLTTVINTAPLRIFWKDKNLLYLGCNSAFAKDMGEEYPQNIIAKDDYQLAWKDNAELYRADDRFIMDTGIPKLSYEERQDGTDGNSNWLRISKVPLHNEANQIIGILGIYENITEQKLAQEHIHYLANFDSLTGLPNRSQLEDHLKYAISVAKRNNGHLALFFLDLDHFKDINDTLGHSIGDKLLIELANRLRFALCEQGTVSRLGGDEFICLLPDTDAHGAELIASKLLAIIDQPFKIGHYFLSLTASIGIAIYPNDGMNLETLSRSADTAMYRAKQEGRHGFRFFTQEMQARSIRNLQVLNALRHALELGQLQVYYQAQITIPSRRIIGAEALLRWLHPELGMVSPAEFIAIEEDNGLILPIGEWVLRTAVRQAKIWQDNAYGPLIVAVNLSAVQFRHPNLPKLVLQILEEEGLSPKYLELELTESVAMHNPQEAIAVINRLQERGIRMSIDDFGTGYSSLSYLKKFNVYKLKIDQSFVRDISTDPEDRAIVSAIINLSKSLGLQTIAEGVETEEQLALLCEQGCDEAQGFLFAKPVPAEQFEALLKLDAERILVA